MSWAARTGILASILVGLVYARAHAAAPPNPMNTVCFDTSDRVELCYAEHLLDDVSKPILVFIPGWTMPASIWERQLAHFSGGHSLLAFDPRGQGMSAAPGFGYTLERRVQDLKELLDRYPNRSFILVGWSLAVLESLAYVDRHGEDRLVGLILVDNSVGEGPDGPPKKKGNPFFDALRSNRKETLRSFVEAMFRTRTDALLRDKVLDSALKMDVEDSIRLLSHGKPRAYWKETLYRVSRPVLYLVTPKWEDQAKLLTQKHPQATALVFEHAGHALFWDEASKFNLAVDEFVRRLDP